MLGLFKVRIRVRMVLGLGLGLVSFWSAKLLDSWIDKLIKANKISNLFWNIIASRNFQELKWKIKTRILYQNIYLDIFNNLKI
jgi:hypothetical protein